LNWNRGLRKKLTHQTTARRRGKQGATRNAQQKQKNIAETKRRKSTLPAKIRKTKKKEEIAEQKQIGE
jgi:hypothetical protein